MQMAMSVLLAVILSVDEALHNLGAFFCVTLHLFSAGGRHLSAVAELLPLIKRLKELHT